MTRMGPPKTTTPRCRRCITPTDATITARFAYESGRYEIALCDRHSGMFDREMLSWVRLAEELPERLTYFPPSEGSKDNGGPTVAPSRPKPVETEPEQPALTTAEARAIVDPGFEFTWHAIERMVERKIDRADVLRVIRSPGKVRRSGSAEGTHIYQHDGIAVVVNETEKVIITVAWQPELERI